jgi:hypothetical protein
LQRLDLSQPISTSLGLECANPAEMCGQSQPTTAWLDRHIDYPVPEAGKRQANRLQQLSHHRAAGGQDHVRRERNRSAAQLRLRSASPAMPHVASDPIKF